MTAKSIPLIERVARIFERETAKDTDRPRSTWKQYRELLEESNPSAERVVELARELGLDERYVELHMAAIQRRRYLQEMAAEADGDGADRRLVECESRLADLAEDAKKIRRQIEEVHKHREATRATILQRDQANDAVRRVEHAFATLFSIDEPMPDDLVGLGVDPDIEATARRLQISIPRLGKGEISDAPST